MTNGNKQPRDGSQDHAVIVGINSYPAIGPLKGPENDAQAFRKWLMTPAGGSVPAAHIRYIISSDFPEPIRPKDAKPTLDLVDAAFTELAIQAFDGKVGRRLYIFLAGHGFSPSVGHGIDQNNSALLMANAEKRALGFHIPGQTYAEWFRNAGAFDEIILLMDCCRDDYPNVPVHFPPFNDLKRVDAADVKCFYAFATKWAYKAREKCFDGSPEYRGIFSWLLMKGLEGAAADEGRITGTSLAGYLYEQLPRHDPSGQEPRFIYEHDRDIVFREDLGIQMADVTFRFGGKSPDPVELIGPNAAVLRRLDPTAGPTTLKLGRGLYLVRTPLTQSIFEVHTGEGGQDVHIN